MNGDRPLPLPLVAGVALLLGVIWGIGLVTVIYWIALGVLA